MVEQVPGNTGGDLRTINHVQSTESRITSFTLKAKQKYAVKVLP